MQSSIGGSSYMSRSSRVKPFQNENLFVADEKVARFNRMADSDPTMMNQDYAATLLLQMRRIATNEVLQSSPPFINNTTKDMAVHLISPVQRPKERSIKILPAGPRCLTLPSSAMSVDFPLKFSSLATNGNSSSLLLQSTTERFRAVSIGGINDLEGHHNDDWMKAAMNNVGKGEHGRVSPLHLGFSHDVSSLSDTQHDSSTCSSRFVVTPNAPKKKLVFDCAATLNEALHNPYQQLVQSISKDSTYEVDPDSDEEEEEEEENMNVDYGVYVKESDRNIDDDVPFALMNPLNSKKLISNPSAPISRKYVGETLAPNVKARDVLRKKFSWKSFPELETYLIDHRNQYLECSSAMNYTKAQKHYNNELTQGLLQLAANKGYIFEEFTFAAVRDRIRCFYKSFVQATKKKKRVHYHHHHHGHNKNQIANNKGTAQHHGGI